MTAEARRMALASSAPKIFLRPLFQRWVKIRKENSPSSHCFIAAGEKYSRRLTATSETNMTPV